MKKIIAVSLFLLLHLYAFPQKLSNGIYWITLADKAGNSYTIAKPSEFLSQRAIDRRNRQKISIKEEDLPVSKIYIDSLKNLGLNILGSSKWFNAVVVESYDTLLLDTLNRISFVSPFEYKNLSQNTKGNRKSYSSEPTSLITPLQYGEAMKQINLFNGEELHNQGYLGEGYQIAVIDGGFYKADVIPAFESLRNEGRLLAFKDFSHSETPFFSTSSHGMAVLSTMAAYDPGKFIGTAPKASYYLLKSEIVESESRLEEAYWAIAAEFADSAGADIINSSLGYSIFDDPDLNYSYEDMDGKTTLVTRAAEKAFSKGMVVVISAGNEGNKSWKYLTAPSDGPNVLSIGACDSLGNVAYFSSRGPSYDNRIKPDIIAIGYKTAIINSTGTVSRGNGTSFAAPQIAGIIACLWESAPQKTNLEIIETIRRSASGYHSPNDSAGYGVPDFRTAMFLLNTNKTIFDQHELIVVPNPSDGIFEIYSQNLISGKANINVYNMSGNKIYSGTVSFNNGFIKLDIQSREAGVYFIVINSGKKTYFTKLIKV